MKDQQKLKYYKIPKVLLTKQYSCLSSDAVLLYGMLLDRDSLSQANSHNGAWITQQGEVYVFCTLEEIQQQLHCGHDKATKLYRELELVGLIKRIPVGRGKPYQIVVYPPVSRSGLSAANSAGNRQSRSDNLASNDTDRLLTDNNTTMGHNDTPRADVLQIWDVVASYNTLYNTYPPNRRGNYHNGLSIYRKMVTTQAEAIIAQDNLAKWINSTAWKKDGGRYIPLLTNYLQRGYTNKQIPLSKTTQWGSGELGEAELEAIKKMMQG